VPPTTDLRRLLGTLARGGVEFVIVGGVAAVVQGAPIATFDVDIVPARDPANLARLAAVLEDLDAVYREHLPRRLAATAEQLAGPGRHLLMTAAGPLDVLGSVGAGLSFLDLAERSIEIELDGLALGVATLETLIRLKEHANRPKDRAVLSILRATLAESRRGED
jgi:hypothetical protein